MNRAATIAAAVLLATASFAGVFAIWTIAARSRATGSEGRFSEVPPGPPGSTSIEPGHLVLASLPDGRILVLCNERGAEALALYRVEPDGSLEFLAARRITWDLKAWDFSSAGKGLAVRDAQDAIEEGERARHRRPFRDLLDEAEARRRAEEAELRRLNEDEARRLREREGK